MDTGTASHCRINLTHVTIGPRRGGGLVTDGGLLTVILMQRATKVTLNTQHPKVVKNIFHWLVVVPGRWPGLVA